MQQEDEDVRARNKKQVSFVRTLTEKKQECYCESKNRFLKK